jgi:hypothetical protein
MTDTGTSSSLCSSLVHYRYIHLLGEFERTRQESAEPYSNALSQHWDGVTTKNHELQPGSLVVRPKFCWSQTSSNTLQLFQRARLKQGPTSAVGLYKVAQVQVNVLALNEVPDVLFAAVPTCGQSQRGNVQSWKQYHAIPLRENSTHDKFFNTRAWSRNTPSSFGSHIVPKVPCRTREFCSPRHEG